MQITEALIQKFFDRRCSPEEAQFVADFLAENPLAAEKFLNKDWTIAESDVEIDEEIRSTMWTEIARETTRLEKRELPRYYKWLSIAASVILVVGIWALFALNDRAELVDMPPQQAASAPTAVKEIVLENVSDRPTEYRLADGSQVILHPNAQLRFNQNFSADRRDLVLKGEALFTVAKDSSRPFTVHAGLFSTTALGTIFKVSEASGKYNIELLEGKIVIKTSKDNLKGWKNDVVLKAGQVMRYDVSKSKLAISSEEAEKKKTSDSSADLANGAALKFDNTMLADAFKKLSKHYSQKIDFSDKELTGMFFSGTILKEDSLEMILKVIAQMNSLTVTKTDNGFEVRKIQ